MISTFNNSVLGDAFPTFRALWALWTLWTSRTPCITNRMGYWTRIGVTLKCCHAIMWTFAFDQSTI